MSSLSEIRKLILQDHRSDDLIVANRLAKKMQITDQTRGAITARAERLIGDIRASGKPGLMDTFLSEYGLSSNEGIALMTLAEALLRVPDAKTIDALIEDKITGSEWAAHAGHSHSALINFSTRALMITDAILQTNTQGDVAGSVRQAAKRLGEPVIRVAVKRAMKELGQQFVLGETVEEALRRGLKLHSRGYGYSYDMLGEAAITAEDANHYYNAYKGAINRLTQSCQAADCRENPGISVKLSALHPRYEVSQRQRVMDELVSRVRSLAVLAASANMGFNVDAEEADRLDLSLDVIEAVARTPELSDWDGFGVVVQAYGKRASHVIDWLYELAEQLDRKFMVRLVKGAYWDTEIKLSQVAGLSGFPVFQQKRTTDVSYICCAWQLMNHAHRLYPQFATHNAHTVSAILELAKRSDLDDSLSYEFQRLHGMGEELHDIVLRQEKTRCRIYAPVGAHEDLLAYLVRRLLENGANSSFVNQLNDPTVDAKQLAADPFKVLEDSEPGGKHSPIVDARDLYAERENSMGWDLADSLHLSSIEKARSPYLQHQWHAMPMIASDNQSSPPSSSSHELILDPTNPARTVGTLNVATKQHVEKALTAACVWSNANRQERARVLVHASKLLERQHGELFAVLAREAGKSTLDAISELREAVDFLRYYAAQSLNQQESAQPLGIVVCISPWNFPLAIFLGQVSAALAAGNAVIAKPADPTPLIAALAVSILYEAGVPRSALQLLPGSGELIGSALTSDPRVAGVCFTGSTRVAKLIHQSMAAHLAPEAQLIAETGGLNAMIVDSTALPEQAVKDIVVSAFQSAGQRCSAVRIVCVQEDIHEPLVQMLSGAMHELIIGDPLNFSTDVGPAISADAARGIREYINQAEAEGRLIDQLLPNTALAGHFISPAMIRISRIQDVEREVFGPVLHVLSYQADELDTLIDEINDTGYGLTFGLQTRISERVERVSGAVLAGNIYVNRNQIGAVVGSQPFGGEGLSGTGPKAGGPNYLQAFYRSESFVEPALPTETSLVSKTDVQQLIDAQKISTEALEQIQLPGPTGESNELSLYPRGIILCLGPSVSAASEQARIAQQCGCVPVTVAPDCLGEGCLSGFLERQHIASLNGFAAVACCSESSDLRAIRQALAERDGAILPLITSLKNMSQYCLIERHICIDTTAAGGNAALIAAY